MPTINSPTFNDDDRRAVAAIARKRGYLAEARAKSPSLIASIEREIEASEAALVTAQAAASSYEIERTELAVATALRQQALATLNTSLEVELEAAARIVHEAEVAKYLEAARTRRVEAARSAASSAYSRAAKEIADRNAAVAFSERLAGAVVDREEQRIPTETRAAVIAWARLVLPVEGLDAYLRSCEKRKGHRSYDEPPPVEDFERACRAFFASVERLREAAAKQAAELAEVAQ